MLAIIALGSHVCHSIETTSILVVFLCPNFPVAVQLEYSCFTSIIIIIAIAGSTALERKTYLYVMTGYDTTACRRSMYIIE